jgi:hypothetical protein
MHLLKRGVPFCWDEATQQSFEALKSALTSAPLLSAQDFGNDLLLYSAAIESIISMVLVQEDDALEEHVIYYLSRGLVVPELNYTHIEKLSLESIHVVQWFFHYILLRNTIVIAIVNPFQYVLT